MKIRTLVAVALVVGAFVLAARADSLRVANVDSGIRYIRIYDSASGDDLFSSAMSAGDSVVVKVAPAYRGAVLNVYWADFDGSAEDQFLVNFPVEGGDLSVAVWGSSPFGFVAYVTEVAGFAGVEPVGGALAFAAGFALAATVRIFRAGLRWVKRAANPGGVGAE